MTVATLAVPAVIALIVTLLTNQLTSGREARARAVMARRAAVLDVQEALVRLRVARQRYGTALTGIVGAREPGGARTLYAPEVPVEVLLAVFEADAVFEAALARLDAREDVLSTAVTRWAELAFIASLSKEVDAAAEQAAFDEVNASVRSALAAIGT